MLFNKIMKYAFFLKFFCMKFFLIAGYHNKHIAYIPIADI